MIDIIMNTMAGLAVLLFLQIALNQQVPPPTPTRGRLVIKINLNSLHKGLHRPSFFLSRIYDNNEEIYFDDQINSHRSVFKYTDDPNAQISFERLLFKGMKGNNEWEIHLLDPMEGVYTLGVIYSDHNNFLKEQTPVELTVQSYFELHENGIEYKSRKITKMLSSPTEYEKFVFNVTPSMNGV